MSKFDTLTDQEIVPSIAKYGDQLDSFPVELNSIEPSTQLQQYLLDKCTEYIGNQWKALSLSQVAIKRITAGTSNIIFTITNLIPHLDTESPKTVLLRLYGKFLSASFSNQLKDAVVFTILSERSLGPKLYGIFERGRVEEFISSRGLFTADIRSARISPLVASRMAQIHNLRVPIAKSPRFLFDTMREWLEGAEKISASHQFENLGDQINWLQGILEGIQSPVCFCHNDLQAGNILLRNTETKRSPEDLLVIDYEYCSYNYRNYDLANFFCEWAFEYSTEFEDGFCYSPRNIPTGAEKNEFIRTYVEQWNLFSDDLMLMEECEDLLESVRMFELASHIFWALWSIRQSQSSSIGFGYAAYARVRMQLYIDLKKSIFVEK